MRQSYELQVPIEFKSSNGKVYRTSIQMSAAERGTEFLWERSTLKPEKKQGQEQTPALRRLPGNRPDGPDRP